MRVKRALFSVYDKRGIANFSRELISLGVEIIATSGTLNFLKDRGVQLVKHVSDYTKSPEILDGRVKTEHQILIAGVLALRNNKDHLRELKRLGIHPIDMVVCNFPIEEVGNRDGELKRVVEHIDIGGPNITRAAAKNFENVVVIVNPDKYGPICRELKDNGDVSHKERLLLAIEAFKETTKYDRLIYKFLRKFK